MAERSPAATPCPRCGNALAIGGGAPVNFCPACGHDLRGPGSGTGQLANALLGAVVADRYRLLALVGEGGMGAVYKAEHIRMGKALALKILRGDFARDPAAVERFSAEAQIVSRLSHPHTIAVFDFGEMGDAALGDGFYLAMEYVPGRDLAAALREGGGRIPERRAAEIARQTLGSLAEAHDAGIVHRDMKPGNLMLRPTRSGEDFVKVLDFGIAKLRDETAGLSTTSAGAIVGTPNYLAPEQARGEPVDARTDLYALGCVLYECAAGRPPFVAPNPMAVVTAHLHEAPAPLGDRADVSPAYAAAVMKALSKRPQDRFASADEMREALGEVAARRRAPTGPIRPDVTGELGIARREDFEELERQVRALKRSRIAAPLALALLAGLVGLVAWRWAGVYGWLSRTSPELAAALPAELRPAAHFDGREHEPNDAPAQANALPLPPGPDGRPGGGEAAMRGFVGAKLSATSGDVDVYRVKVPDGAGERVLVAEWSAEGGEGIRGLDVALTLNRERTDEGRTSAPLLASADRGGPGRPETLAAAAGPGTYYLAVRERHPAEETPVEKPTDPYRLVVRLVDRREGAEVEPNDAPDDPTARVRRYPGWRAVALRTPLAPGRVVEAETGAEDPDVLAAVAAPDGAAPALVLLVPEPGLALAAERWVPDAEDLAPGAGDRERFERAGPPGAAGAVLAVALPPGAGADAPALVRVRAAAGAGPYRALALGADPASGAALEALAAELERAGRAEAAAAVRGARGPAGPAAP